jgi:hypothetical protein
MGYIERILGDSERTIYRTHRHIIVLFRRILAWLLAFVLFLGGGIVMLVWKNAAQGERIRWWIGLGVLCTLAIPLFLLIKGWRRSREGGDTFRQIWRPMLFGLLILAIGVVVMVFAGSNQTGWIGVGLAIIPFVVLVRAILDYVNERFIITNRRVVEVKGIINKHVRDSALEKVNDVDLKQSFLGRIFSYGTVEIITGSDIGMNQFPLIHNPVRFKKAMLNAKEQLSGIAPEMVLERPVAAGTAGGATAGATPAGATAAGQSITDLIQELAELRDKGLLTDAEFEKKKKEMLARL